MTSAEARKMRPTSSKTDNKHDGADFRVCDLCKKPIASETAYKRHVAYCRRTLGKPRKRKRSCKHCHTAKSKCTFESPCARCASKGLECEYERPAVAALSPPSSHHSSEQQDASMSEASETSPPYTIDTPRSVHADTVTVAHPRLDGFARPDPPPLQQPQQPQPPQPPPLQFPLLQKMPRSAHELLTDPSQRVSTAILLDLFRALPQMMTSRETLPPYIHGQWNKDDVPLPITKCMHISQLYLQRDVTPDGRAAFYSALAEERARLVSLKETADVYHLFASLQVFLAYNIMCALDINPGSDSTFMMNGGVYDELIMFARATFMADKYLPFDVDMIGDPNETWDQFIYAESRRRAALFWFMASRVIMLHDAIKCPPVVGFRGLSLPGPDSLWNAKTREEWEAAREQLRLHSEHPPYGTLMRTFGELIEARSYPDDANYARQISEWLANSHKMGMTVLVASSMT